MYTRPTKLGLCRSKLIQFRQSLQNAPKDQGKAVGMTQEAAELAARSSGALPLVGL